MNIRTNLLGGAMGFAHLAGIGLGSKAKKAKGKAEDQDDEKPGAEDDDEDAPKGKKAKKAKGKAEDDTDDEDKPDAEGDEDDASAEEDDEDKPDASAEDEDEEDAPPPRSKGKKATAEFRRGVAAERKRCAAIFGAKSAAANVPLAASLAFETGMSADAAIRVLKGQPAPSSAGADRSRRNPDLGADPGAQGSGGAKKAWGAAIDKVTSAAKPGGSWGGAIDRAQR